MHNALLCARDVCVCVCVCVCARAPARVCENMYVGAFAECLDALNSDSALSFILAEMQTPKHICKQIGMCECTRTHPCTHKNVRVRKWTLFATINCSHRVSDLCS